LLKKKDLWWKMKAKTKSFQAFISISFYQIYISRGILLFILLVRFPSLYGGHFDLSDVPMRKEEYEPIVAYNQSKLCNLLFAFELNRRLSPYGVHCNAVNPGSLVFTNLQRNSFVYRMLYAASRPFTKSKVCMLFSDGILYKTLSIWLCWSLIFMWKTVVESKITITLNLSINLSLFYVITILERYVDT